MTGDAQKVLDAINGWDFFEKRDSVGAAAYEVFWLNLLRNTFDDELGDLAPDYVNGGDVNRVAMIQLLAKPDSKWWDNTTTPAVETRDDILKKSLADAAGQLTAELGADQTGWTWSKIHTATFKSQALGDAPVAFIFNRGPFEVDGGTATVNNTGTGTNFSKAYSHTAGQTQRDLCRANRALAATDHRSGRPWRVALHPHDGRERPAHPAALRRFHR